MPNVVKGSKQERMVVVPYRPWRRVFSTFLILLAITAAGATGYFNGYYRATVDGKLLGMDRDEIARQLIQAQDENAALRRQVAILDSNSEVDRHANEELQATLTSLRRRVVELEHDVVFYRQVVTDEAGSGLLIGQLDLKATPQAGRFRYRLVLRQQDPDGVRFLNGHVNVNLVGIRESEQVVIPLREISDAEDQLDIKLRFKEFQEIEGELALPANLKPEGVHVAAVSTSPVAATVSKTFSWVVADSQTAE
ncbi:MAG: DUF6776 family protein [Pseudohongiellaceae bacterium]